MPPLKEVWSRVRSAAGRPAARRRVRSARTLCPSCPQRLGIDNDTLWSIVASDVPALLTQLRREAGFRVIGTTTVRAAEPPAMSVFRRLWAGARALFERVLGRRAPEPAASNPAARARGAASSPPRRWSAAPRLPRLRAAGPRRWQLAAPAAARAVHGCRQTPEDIAAATRIAALADDARLPRAAAAAEGAGEPVGLLELVRRGDRARAGARPRSSPRRSARCAGATASTSGACSSPACRPAARSPRCWACGAPTSSPACSSIRASPAARRRRRSPRSAC